MGRTARASYRLRPSILSYISITLFPLPMNATCTTTLNANLGPAPSALGVQCSCDVEPYMRRVPHLSHRNTILGTAPGLSVKSGPRKDSPRTDLGTKGPPQSGGCTSTRHAYRAAVCN